MKRIPGFAAYAILNNDGNVFTSLYFPTQLLFHYLGIVIKYENMSYKVAVHHAHQVLSLTGKASKYIKDLFDAPDVSNFQNSHPQNLLAISSKNEVESIRLRTLEYEMIIAQHGNFTIIVTQNPSKSEEKKSSGDDKKEGEEKKEAP